MRPILILIVICLLPLLVTLGPLTPKKDQGLWSQLSVSQHILLTKAKEEFQVNGGQRAGSKRLTPAYLELLYQYVNTKLKGQEDNSTYASEGILAKAFLPLDVTENKHRGLSLIFKYSDQLKDATSAELIFTIRRNMSELISESHVKLFLQRGSKDTAHKTIYKGLFPLDTDDEDPDEDLLHVPFDVSAILRHGHGAMKAGDAFNFHLEMKDSQKMLTPSDFLDLDATSQKPLLVGYYVGTKQGPLGPALSQWRRQRRSLEPVTTSGMPTTTTTHETPEITTTPQGVWTLGEGKYCELRQWIVPTKELRFPWLLLPESLGPNYCFGSCPSPLQHSYYNSTTNALIIDRMRTVRKPEDMPILPKCHCVPIEFTATTLLTEAEEGYYRIDKVHDLIVSRCGCR